MAEINPKEPLKPKELPTCSKTFEHLFPGNRWNDLVLFNPLNVPHLLGEILWSGAERENKLIKASGRTKESLAARENFAFVDQLSMGYATLDLTPVDDKFNVTEVVDLINIQAGEKWGRVLDQ